jgi:ABC-type Zn uptake system ZnuABC Zn-binding protein ZnuA
MRLPKKIIICAVFGIFATSIAGCAKTNSVDSSEGKLLVATTVSPITSIVSQIAGNRVSVQGIVPEGVNSHTFEPPPSTAKLLSKADVIFVNGLKLEDPTKDMAAANMKPGARIVELGTQSIAKADWIFDFSFPAKDGKPNPHLWTDPLYAIKYAKTVRDALTSADPEGKAVFAKNYANFEQVATSISNSLKSDQKSLPKDSRTLLTYHDAYAYFSRDYGWNVIGAIQPSNFEDPTPKEIARLIDQVRSAKVEAIFGSEVFPSKVLEEIGNETGVRYVDTLRDDDLLGIPGQPEHSWQALMRSNYVTMIEALGGTCPALKSLDLDVKGDSATYPQ